MNLLKYIAIDVVATGVLLFISFIISLVIDISISDMLFIEFIIFLLLSVIVTSIARGKVRKAVFKFDKEEKKKYRRKFRNSDKIVFNLSLITLLLFLLSLYLI